MYIIPQQKLMIKPWNWLYGFIPSSDLHLKKFIPKKNLYWTSSARNGIYLLLESLKSNNNQTLIVAIPAFTCKVVKNSVQKANCKIRYYDSSIICDKKDIELMIKEGKKPHVIVISYNFGYLPKDIKQIAKICKENNIILIEDCAQALGAKQEGTLAGSFGDYAIYSFGISKNIGFSGGVIASNQERNYTKQTKAPITHTIKIIIESILGPIILNKYLYPIFQKTLEHKVLNNSKYPKLDFSSSKFSRRIIYHLAKNYHQKIKNRQNNFKKITGNNSEDACLYFPIIPEKKEKIVHFANKNKIEISNLKSFIFLPKKNSINEHRFPKSWKAAENHLAIALLRNSKEINEIRRVLKNV